MHSLLRALWRNCDANETRQIIRSRANNNFCGFELNSYELHDTFFFCKGEREIAWIRTRFCCRSSIKHMQAINILGCLCIMLHTLAPRNTLEVFSLVPFMFSFLQHFFMRSLEEQVYEPPRSFLSFLLSLAFLALCVKICLPSVTVQVFSLRT